MEAKYTPGRLKLFQVGDPFEYLCPATEDGESLLTITVEGNTSFAAVFKDANARRLVACWNACIGLHTESLERNAPLADQIVDALNQRDELLEALKYHQEQTRPIQKSIDAIAKATGQ